MNFSDLHSSTRATLWSLARERLAAGEFKNDGSFTAAGDHIELQAPVDGGKQVPVRFPVLTFADKTRALGEPFVVEPKPETIGWDPAMVLGNGKDTPHMTGAQFWERVLPLVPVVADDPENHRHHLEILRRFAQERSIFGPGGTLPDPGMRTMTFNGVPLVPDDRYYIVHPISGGRTRSAPFTQSPKARRASPAAPSTPPAPSGSEPPQAGS